MATQFESAIVRIWSTERNIVGVGFLVDEQKILTCAHVVATALNIPDDTIDPPTKKIKVDFPLVAKEKFLTADVIFWKSVHSGNTTVSESEEDIAGLQLDTDPPTNVQPVDLILAEDIWNHSFRAFGFPASYADGIWASGVLRGRQATEWIQIEDVKQTGYFIAPGFSGGPVWDEELNGVVGMVVAADRHPDLRTAFMIPTGVLARAWQTLKPQLPLAIHELESEKTIPSPVKRLRRLEQANKFRKYAFVTAGLVILLMFCFDWVDVLDVFTLDTRMESLTIWFGDFFVPKKINDEKIAIITITKETIDAHDENTSWWGKYAALVEKLSQAGARVIAFDMAFENEKSFDPEFIDAIERAKNKKPGTAVIVSINKFKENEFTPVIVDGLQQAVSGYGAFCLGSKLNPTNIVPLVISKPLTLTKQTFANLKQKIPEDILEKLKSLENQEFTTEEAFLKTIETLIGDQRYTQHIVEQSLKSDDIPSLALKAVEAYEGRTKRIIDFKHHQILWDAASGSQNYYNFTAEEIVTKSQPGCPIIQRNDRIAELFIDLSPAKMLKKVTWTYKDVIQANVEELHQFQEKIVLIGKEKKDDIHSVYWGEKRYGVELHADAVNTILNNVTIRRARAGWQLIIMIFLGLWSAYFRTRTTPTRHYWRVCVFIGIQGIYVIVTLYLYSQFHILLNAVYHIGTCWLTYWAIGKVESKWFREV